VELPVETLVGTAVAMMTILLEERIDPFMLVDLLLCKDDGVAKTAIVESHDSP
jgi:hypothetical protein